MSELVKRLKQAADANFADVQVRQYSGRGMMGQYCTAVTGSFEECMQLIGDVIKTYAREIADGFRDSRTGEQDNYLAAEQDMLDTYVDLLLDYERDSLGHDTVLYWRNLRWPEDDSED